MNTIRLGLGFWIILYVAYRYKKIWNGILDYYDRLFCLSFLSSIQQQIYCLLTFGIRWDLFRWFQCIIVYLFFSIPINNLFHLFNDKIIKCSFHLTFNTYAQAYLKQTFEMTESDDFRLQSDRTSKDCGSKFKWSYNYIIHY